MRRLIVGVLAFLALTGGAQAQSCSGTPNANQICAGPTSGGSGFPSFRAQVNADIPVGAANTVKGTLNGTSETDLTATQLTTLCNTVTASLSGCVPSFPNTVTTFFRGDGTYNVPPTVTSGAPGYAPAFPNNTTTFFRGDGTYAVPLNSAAVDAAFGSTRGSILERGSGGWTTVTPGTSGLPYVSNGTGADPGYQALTAPNASYLAPFTGAVTRSLQSRLQDTVNYLDFNPHLDCTTDDSGALQAAINALGGNGGIVRMPDFSFCSAIASTVNYTTSANQRGVLILGSTHGWHHDLGAQDWGACHFKWTGSSGGTMFSMKAVSGASNQRIDGGGMDGCSLDGNADLGGTGIEIESVQNAVFDIYGARWSTTVLQTDTLVTGSTLGEAADVQHNHIRIWGDQYLSGDGAVMILNGSSNADTSLNWFEATAIYLNTIPFQLNNTDNNFFWLRGFQFGGGTATSGAVCAANASAAQTCRNNYFQYVEIEPQAGKQSIYFQGTEIATNASGPNYLDAFDSSNTTILPTFGTGVAVDWRSSGLAGQTPSRFFGGPLTVAGTLAVSGTSNIGAAFTSSFTPVITCGAGAPTTITPTLRYQQFGKLLYFTAQFSLVNIGTCTTSLKFTVPVTSQNTMAFSLNAINGSTFQPEVAQLAQNSNLATVATSGGAFPGVNGNFIQVSGFYETP